MITPEDVHANLERIAEAFVQASQRAVEDDVMRYMGLMVLHFTAGMCRLSEVQDREDLQGYALALFLMGYQAGEQDWGAREW